MIIFTDEQASVSLNLGMAAQAQVIVRLHKHLLVDRAMRLMARGAAFAQGFMFEHKTSRLFPMAFRALLIETRHRQAAPGLHDVASVRIVALHAVHLPFAHGMMLRKIKLRVNIEMAGEARLRIAARVHDKFTAPAAHGNVLAPRAVTRFAAVSADRGRPSTFHRLRMGIRR